MPLEILVIDEPFLYFPHYAVVVLLVFERPVRHWLTVLLVRLPTLECLFGNRDTEADREPLTDAGRFHIPVLIALLHTRGHGLGVDLALTVIALPLLDHDLVDRTSVIVVRILNRPLFLNDRQVRILLLPLVRHLRILKSLRHL